MRRRGLAIGLCVGGSSIGDVAFPVALKHALYSQTLGFGWAVRGHRIRNFSIYEHSLWTREGTPPATTRENFPPKGLHQATSLYSLVAAIFFSFWGLWIPYFFIVPFAIEKVHMNPDLAFYMLSMLRAEQRRAPLLAARDQLDRADILGHRPIWNSNLLIRSGGRGCTSLPGSKWALLEDGTP
ncbi:hypothetical protein BDW68DRAFT_174728 [Aspergillus falconensis]